MILTEEKLVKLKLPVAEFIHYRKVKFAITCDPTMTPICSLFVSGFWALGIVFMQNFH